MSRIRVLLADDHKHVLEYVREVLSAEFEIVAAVSDGKSALAATAQLQPDVAVLDISMPVLTGIEVARLLRDMNSPVKIVFLTNFEDPVTCRAAMETGAAGYVIKPRLVTDLIPAIKLATEGRRFISPGSEWEVLE